MVFVYIISFILFTILQYYIAKQFEAAAADKGYRHSRYFHLCFWLGFVGYILVAALPDRGKAQAPNPGYTPVTYTPSGDTDSEEDSSDSDEITFPRAPIGGTYSTPRGESNIMCTTCGRIQFKGNRVCNRCGATFINMR